VKLSGAWSDYIGGDAFIIPIEIKYTQQRGTQDEASCWRRGDRAGGAVASPG
jgi:hypothetical protein